MGPRNRFQGMNSASLCSLAGRYDNPLPPRFLAPIASLKIPAQSAKLFSSRRNWDSPNPSPASECAPHPLVQAGGTLACGRGVGEVQIPTRGHTLWYSVYISTLYTGIHRLKSPPLTFCLFPLPTQICRLWFSYSRNVYGRKSVILSRLEQGKEGTALFGFLFQYRISRGFSPPPPAAAQEAWNTHFYHPSTPRQIYDSVGTKKGIYVQCTLFKWVLSTCTSYPLRIESK